MKKLKLFVFSVMLVLSSCNNKLETIITDYGKVGTWDSYYYDDVRKEERILSYKFYKNGRCERYTINVFNGERIAQYSDRPRWELVNDSIIEFLCYERYKILEYSKDSIVLKGGIGDRDILFVKTREDWKTNTRSIVHRDSLEKFKIDKPCVIY